MKLCKDCRWSTSGRDSALCKKKAYKSAVSGHVEYADCYAIRLNTGECGPEGKWWEQKPYSRWTQLIHDIRHWWSK